MQKVNFLAIWLCSSFLSIVFHFSCFLFYFDTANIQKHRLKDVLEKVLKKYINYLKLRKTSTESIKAILGEIHFTKICIIIHIFAKMISFAWAFAVILLFFSAHSSGCLRLSQ